ncbi:MAG: DUF2948 family protein [Beijerinckiaceae bacterium]
MAKKPRKPPNPKDGETLHLLALDGEDLAVLSAHLQDAIVRVADMAMRPADRRFALIASRFDWNAATSGGALRRRPSGVHFDHVQRVRLSGFTQDRSDLVLNLLGIVFHPGEEAPGGQIDLVFSAGAAIRLDVECIDAQLNDIGRGWRTRSRPEHDLPGPDSSQGPAPENTPPEKS